MPFIQHTAQGVEDRRSRILQCGPPNSRKTTNFLTWPKPIIFVNVPGEKGQDTIPVGVPGITAFNFIQPDNATTFAISKAVDDLDRLIMEILTKKHGDFQTLHIEGLHKLHELYVDVASDGAFSAGDEFDPRHYGKARTMMLDLITRVCLSGAPHVGFSCWDDYEKDRQKKSTENTQDYNKSVGEHIYPALFGKMAKRIMGEFSVVCFNTQRVNGKGLREWVWQIQPAGEVWGAGVKLPPERAATLPPYIPMGFESLRAILYSTP